MIVSTSVRGPLYFGIKVANKHPQHQLLVDYCSCLCMCQYDSYRADLSTTVLAEATERNSAKRHQGRHDSIASESCVRRMADTKRSYGSRMETV
jgi:hypothetical protein